VHELTVARELLQTLVEPALGLLLLLLLLGERRARGAQRR
jgi:hypothetical protein